MGRPSNHCPVRAGISAIGKGLVEVNRDLDVEAILLMHQTNLGVTPHRGFVTPHDPLSFWGYGRDHSNKETNHLTRAEFDSTRVCPGTMLRERGSLCWATTDTNSVCGGDSGGPVLQNGAIVGMLTSIRTEDGTADCSKVFLAQALKIQEMRPWLDQMISDADPFD